MKIRFLLLLIYGISLSAQTSVNIDSLTHELVRGIETDSLKFRAIYKFIEDNVVYDQDAYKHGNRRINRGSSDVLLRGKAVCWGYSELFREMCIAVGVQAATIVGYAPTDIPARFLDDANHAWNAISLNGEWHLLDITWNVGLKGGNDELMHRYGVDYLMTPPNIFTLNHYPILQMWQLSDCPISWNEFKNITSIDMSVDKNCGINYKTEISKYFNKSYLEQLNEQAMFAYSISSTLSNKRNIGHSMIDIAIIKKERADSLFEIGAHQSSLEYFESAQLIFAGAVQYCELYDWQKQAYIFNALNLAQALYQVYYLESSSHVRIIDQFENILKLLDEFEISKELEKEIYRITESHIAAITKHNTESK